MTTKPPDCAVHGEKQIFVRSEICKGLVCIECIKDGLFIEDVEQEIIELYPELFK